MSLQLTPKSSFGLQHPLALYQCTTVFNKCTKFQFRTGKTSGHYLASGLSSFLFFNFSIVNNRVLLCIAHLFGATAANNNTTTGMKCTRYSKYCKEVALKSRHVHCIKSPPAPTHPPGSPLLFSSSILCQNLPRHYRHCHRRHCCCRRHHPHEH